MTKPNFLSLKDSLTHITFFTKDDFFPGLLIELEDGKHICLIKFLFEVFDEEYDNRTHLFFSVVDPDDRSSRVCIQFQKRVPGFSFRDPNSTFL